MTLLRKWMPSPGLSAVLLVLWLLLARSTAPGQVVLGVLAALAVPHVTASLRFTATRVRNPWGGLRYLLRVAMDVVQSNLVVGWGVLRARRRLPSAAFVVIPLDLRDPLGLAVLCMVTTIVPGTVWSELALDRSAMLLHVWDVDDQDAFVARFKARYERPLRDIFE